MYRVDAGADDQPYVVWSVPYDTIGVVRQAQYELGSGTSPTILGEGKYVAITDNAEQLNVVVYRTEAGLSPDQQVVCKVPVFDFPGGGKGAGPRSISAPGRWCGRNWRAPSQSRTTPHSTTSGQG